jgi:23S rRNA pseudouridine2604 synthase
MSETVRINKYIANAGICSRRDADKLVESGKVMVNGLVATPGMGIHAGDTVCVNGKVIKAKDDKVVLAFYKPVGITCTERDKFAEKTILEYVKYPVRVTYAGRLDKDSEGLILLTNDGDLIQALMKGSHHHEKEYVVKTDKEITDRFLEKMSQGVYLRELDRTTRPCQITGVGKNTFKIVLTQGLNRQIRRMCKELGYTVTSLKRIRIEKITIDGLKIGQYRELTEKEKENLYETVGLK